MGVTIAQLSPSGHTTGLLRIVTQPDGTLMLEIDDGRDGPPAAIHLDLAGSQRLGAAATSHCVDQELARRPQPRGAYLPLDRAHVDARLGAAMDRGHDGHSTPPARLSADGDRLTDWVR